MSQIHSRLHSPPHNSAPSQYRSQFQAPNSGQNRSAGETIRRNLNETENARVCPLEYRDRQTAPKCNPVTEDTINRTEALTGSGTHSSLAMQRRYLIAQYELTPEQLTNVRQSLYDRIVELDRQINNKACP